MLLIADIATLWSQYVWPVILLLLGFGMVVFIHELGHFLGCKATGVRVDRFALGFGPRLFGFQKGETDYCIKALPLGGYVKMLGQEDFDAPEDGGESTKDPRSFLNKPIWARMVIVSAGVVMNLILAAVLFVIICSVGTRDVAPVVGGTKAGFPAAEVVTFFDDAASQPASSATSVPADDDDARGLKLGDEILTINGEPISSFRKIGFKAVLADRDEIFDVTFRRDGRIGRCKLKVKMSSKGLLAFGISPCPDVVIALPEDTLIQSLFQTDDRVVKIDERPIKEYRDIEAAAKALTGQSVKVVVRRTNEDETTVDTPIELRPVPTLYNARVLFPNDGSPFIRYKKSTPSEDGKSIEIELADGSKKTLTKADVTFGGQSLLDVLGMAPRLRIVSIVKGDPADEAGLKPGDIITQYANQANPTPKQVRELNKAYVDDGANMVVMRGKETLDPIRIKPKKDKKAYVIGIHSGVETEGTIVAAVRKGSLAAKAGIAPGAVITAINGVKVNSWNDIVAERRKHSSGPVTISWVQGDVAHDEKPIDDIAQAAFLPKNYRFNVFAEGTSFKILMGPKIKKTNPFAAIAWGMEQTWDMLAFQYATLGSLANGTVSTDELRGPLGIGQIGIVLGRRGLMAMVKFMAMISVCLAVFNFLPLPLVDGGLAVMLIIEKVRGKPLSNKLTYIIQMTGMAMILSLFLYVTWNDIWRIIEGL